MPSKTACYRFTSPVLAKDPPLKECPVGYLLRESPSTYALLDYLVCAENMGPLELSRMPRFFAQMVRVHASERSRIDDVRGSQRKSERDAGYGARVLKQHG